MGGLAADHSACAAAVDVEMACVHIIAASGFTIDRTIDARIGRRSVRVAPLSNTALRVADGDGPAEVGTIPTAIGQNVRVTVCCEVREGWLQNRKMRGPLVQSCRGAALGSRCAVDCPVERRS